MSGRDARGLRVLAWPAPETPGVQPYIRLLHEPMPERGVLVRELTKGRALLGRWDLVHAHWPDSLLNRGDEAAVRDSLRRLRLLLRVLRWRRIPLLWTVHNLGAHEALHPELEREFWELWTSAVDGLLSLSESGLKLARQRFPRLAEVPGFVVPHGHYRDAYPPAPPRAEARRALGVDEAARVVLFYGQVRPYKNVPELIRAFRALDDEDAVLLVAGRPSDERTERGVLEAVGDDRRIRTRLRFLEDAETSELFAAADLVALPFREILNSGSALLALSFDRPVLVPARGALSELARELGDDWVVTHDGPLDAETLGSALRRAAAAPEGRRAPLEGRDWPGLVDRTIEAYRRLVSAG